MGRKEIVSSGFKCPTRGPGRKREGFGDCCEIILGFNVTEFIDLTKFLITLKQQAGQNSE
jgi:hypothetical protein